MNQVSQKNFRGWEYAKKGNYHKNLDPNWSYTPTYLKKMEFVRKFISKLPKKTRILDAGCGEGVLVEEFRLKGYLIEGIDLNYESEYVHRGNILDMPYSEDSFEVVLLLDVFEHLSFEDQPKALFEIKRILCSQGKLLISIPNLAHLNSRFQFFLRGQLDRTDIEINHPGERSLKENIKILENAGFKIIRMKGITLTLPFIYRRIICRRPFMFKWLHDILDVIAFPPISMLNLFICENIK